MISTKLSHMLKSKRARKWSTCCCKTRTRQTRAYRTPMEINRPTSPTSSIRSLKEKVIPYFSRGKSWKRTNWILASRNLAMEMRVGFRRTPSGKTSVRFQATSPKSYWLPNGLASWELRIETFRSRIWKLISRRRVLIWMSIGMVVNRVFRKTSTINFLW